MAAVTICRDYTYSPCQFGRVILSRAQQPHLASSDDSGKEPAYQCKRHKRCRFDPWVRKIPWRRVWQPTLIFLPGESHEQGNLVGYSPQGGKELEMTEAPEYAHTHGICNFSIYLLCVVAIDPDLNFEHRNFKPFF